MRTKSAPHADTPPARLVESFRSHFGREPRFAVRAPGRVDTAGLTVTRSAERARVTLSAPLHRFVAALVRPGLLSYLRIRIRGSRIFALRALRYLKP